MLRKERRTGKSKFYVGISRPSSKRRYSTSIGRGNPSARPLLTRIYGTLGCLAITCFFIGLMVFLEKTLPDGSKSQFHPTWKRDVSPIPRRQVATVAFANGETSTGESYNLMLIH